jgi:hypothetical protein
MNKIHTKLPVAAVAGVTVLAISLIGGVLAVVQHVNTAADAFSNHAELAAPWPVLLAQLLGVVAIVRWRDWRGIAGACLIAVTGLLALASISDDEVFKSGQPTWVYVGQVVLIGMSAAAAIPCVPHIRQLVGERRPELVG